MKTPTSSKFGPTCEKPRLHGHPSNCTPLQEATSPLLFTQDHGPWVKPGISQGFTQIASRSPSPAGSQSLDEGPGVRKVGQGYHLASLRRMSNCLPSVHHDEVSRLIVIPQPQYQPLAKPKTFIASQQPYNLGGPCKVCGGNTYDLRLGTTLHRLSEVRTSVLDKMDSVDCVLVNSRSKQ
ncbi:hypothetical protein BV22DRAFT_847543 [Leucogyrophana mollusca]|uniref:Uncharacterized protein n=1 Tax=Leucogyrophana mollusca TaxID=85980 RepID=A0ACB8B3P7_9AGAM|nr:hypothetical protein BV22DRAFT_847543 [Leucogyrophana mollusca]